MPTYEVESPEELEKALSESDTSAGSTLNFNFYDIDDSYVTMVLETVTGDGDEVVVNTVQRGNGNEIEQFSLAIYY